MARTTQEELFERLFEQQEFNLEPLSPPLREDAFNAVWFVVVILSPIIFAAGVFFAQRLFR